MVEVLVAVRREGRVREQGRRVARRVGRDGVEGAAGAVGRRTAGARVELERVLLVHVCTTRHNNMLRDILWILHEA